MSTIIDRLRNEPAYVGALVETLIALAVAFGLDLTGEQVGAVMAAVALLTGYAVRQTAYGPHTVNTIMDADTVISAAERTGRA